MRTDAYILAGLILFSGCAVRRQPRPEPEKVDPELRQKVEYVLKRVEALSVSADLNALGQSTMSEAVEIMDMGPVTAPVLAEKLKSASSNWKFRFWIVDLMGYIDTPKVILPLVEVIEDKAENEKVRIRACESLKELKYPQAAEQLAISMQFVDSLRVKLKMEEVINSLR
ncbi:MAG: HEAT repeat domain-containing protein [Elusimicrobia bacterium]|nr:HEAT repeat domain-containing protein [Elusimicrobiota bacterium]